MSEWAQKKRELLDLSRPSVTEPERPTPQSNPATKRKTHRYVRFGKYRRHRSKNQKVETCPKDLANIRYFKASVWPDEGTPIALDVEKVRCRQTNRPLAGWIVLSYYTHQRRTFKQSPVLFSAFIKHDLRAVDLMTTYSGLTPEQISQGCPDVQIKSELERIFHRYKIIGCALKEDLKSLGLEGTTSNVLDLQDVLYGLNKQPISLKLLSCAILGKKIQEFNEARSRHSAIIDSMATAKLYHYWRRGYLEAKQDQSGFYSFEYLREAALRSEDISDIMRNSKRNKIRRTTRRARSQPDSNRR